MTQDVLYHKERQEAARDALYAYVEQRLTCLVATCVKSPLASVLLYNKKDVVGLIREVLRKEFNE